MTLTLNTEQGKAHTYNHYILYIAPLVVGQFYYA